MREHPVPQQISSYEFRLVGDMTIKQFFQVAGGVVVSLIFYALPLPGFLKWPFVVFFAAFGAALAFLPINERPLSAWVFAFFKAIYSPTHYVFVQDGAEEVFRAGVQGPAIISAPNSVPGTGALPAIDEAEKNFLNKVTNLFQTVTHSPLRGSGPSVHSAQGASVPAAQTQTQVTPVQTIAPAPEPVASFVQEAPQAPAQIQEDKIHTVPVAPIKVAGTANFTVVPAAEALAGEAAGIPQSVSSVFSQAQQAPSTATGATFAPEASPPSPATIPNTIVGQIITKEGKVVDGAIMEIKDSAGRPVRALRSNKVGHFITVTPLKDGEYEIDTEKDGMAFDPVKFTAAGTIIPPILITSKN